MKLDAAALADIARGAAVLGCGGGGDPYIGELMARQAVAQSGPVRLLGLDALADDALVVVIAGIGAPPVLVEKIANGSETELALRQLEQRLGRRADALMPAEIGGLNSLYPLALAAKLGLPMVDADGMGRAFPRLEMTTFHLHGVRATPLALVNSQGESALLETRSDAQLETLIGPLAVAFGGFMSSAGYPQSGADARRAAVPGTVSICLAIGRALREARAARQDATAALLATLHATDYYRHARLVHAGKIVDVSRRIDGRFSVGLVQIDGPDGRAELTVQNEFLMARRGARVLATVPDLITVLEADSGEPITAEALRYGQRVRVLAASVPPIMRSPDALALWGPQAFGIDEPFVPIEARPLV